MPTTTEIDVRIETATLRRDLDAARATIKRLNARLVTYERDLDVLRELNADRERDLAFEYAGRLKAEADVDRLKDELAEARAGVLPY
jgi:hypothetical protein